MKIFSVLVLALLLLFSCGCVAVGEQDSLSFISAMAKCGYDCVVNETASTNELIESCYVGKCKITMRSGENGKLNKITLTSTAKGKNEFSAIAKACVMSSCGFTEQESVELLNSLGIFKTVPTSTMGVAEREKSQFLFSFTADSAGAALIIRNLRLNPTQEPTVTMRSE